MNYLLSILISFFATISIVSAEIPEFLFKEFKPALMTSESYRQYNADVNYSLIYNRFIFKDANDNNQLKEFDPAAKIQSVKVEDRLFIITKKRIVKEILQMEPLITVQYIGRVKPEGKNVGYGGKSETSAVDSYGHITSGGVLHKINTEQSMGTVIGLTLQYEIKKGRKSKNFTNPSKFVKIYPKEIQEKLETYIKEQRIDFNQPDQVVSLYNYAENLTKQ